ncbi:MAG: hypothetical protein UZ21_OP11001000329 [Microgenomates bacterium OLB22]|nr:MAG: hypothetical protein UZ21_OP11001000329 [Microgenomates bacterium OLB22]
MPLPVREFYHRAVRKKLGRLSFTHGDDHTESRKSLFFIQLEDLYDLMQDWDIGETPTVSSDVLGIIAFGSAVRGPLIKTEIYTRKKYYLIGPKIVMVREKTVSPHDADFLVITRKNIRHQRTISADWAGYYELRLLIKGGVHLQVGGREDFLSGVRSRDTVCISALEEGVPLFTTPEFDELVAESGITQKNPRKVHWALEKGKLTGWIE